MPIRIRITVLFAVLVMIILGIVCGSTYYFSYQARINTIKTRLTNRAITTAKLLAQKEIFDQKLVQRIDSLTTISLHNKTVQAYDYENRKIYSYSDVAADTLKVDETILDNARVNGRYFFLISDKEAVAYHYVDDNARIVVVSAAEDYDGKQSLHTLFKILLSGFLIGIAFIMITGYFFSSRLLKPVRKITTDVAEISAQNLTRRIETGKSKDEWFNLADTLNKLLDRLQESFELQRRFISNASHELSTPLTAVSSQIEVALQRERTADEFKIVMKSIYHDVRHMNDLTYTLLEFAKAAGNLGGLEINLVRIDEILMRLPAEMVKSNNQNVVLLEFNDLPDNEEDLLVFGNETLLFTAIRNIALNACKYADDHKAKISLEVKNSLILINISDNGKGIPASQLKTIFQPFFRVDDNISKEGFGLGLSLAERIIKVHKGGIEVESTLNVGSRFTIFLPTAQSLK
ncbi:MAG: HAMP domain-containing sensor histidine kinase [Ferruginibacter sp.]